MYWMVDNLIRVIYSFLKWLNVNVVYDKVRCNSLKSVREGGGHIVWLHVLEGY